LNLRKKTIAGVLWNSFEAFGGKLVQIVMTIFLARILVPEDFGVVGLLIIFTELSKVVLDSGFSQALIRKHDVTESDFTSVFYFNIFVGTLCYVILYFLSPLISDFYDFSELTNISRVVFITIFINSFGVVQNAKIVKEVNFKVLANRTIIANILSGFVAIILAYGGYGVWALVWQMVLSSLLRVVLLWIYSNWLPSHSFEFDVIRKLFIFSRNLLVSGIFDVMASNIQTLLIGKFYTNADLGFYSQARQLSSIPSQTLTSVIKNVTYPALSLIQDDVEQLKQAYRKIIRISMFTVFPLMLGLMAVANNLIPFVLSEKWVPSVPYFELLCLVGAIFPLYSINQNIFLVRGNSRLLLNISVAKRVISLSIIAITIKHSVIALVFGHLFATSLNTIIGMYYSGREISYPLAEQAKDIAGIVVISFFMASVVYLIDFKIEIQSQFLMLVVQSFIGFVLFLVLSFVFKLSVIKDVKEVFRCLVLKN
jgi:O-antigen/teichoic acid export membrane protein